MELKELITRESAVIDRAMRADLDNMTPLDPLLVEVLEYGLFGGGKRVRPLLTILCSRLCGKNDSNAYRLAVAFEFVHAATLFHDDVIDNSDTRRGRMSVVKRFGTVGAILAGDFLLARSMAIIGRYGGPAALEVFVEATMGMVDGEFVQLRQAGLTKMTEDQYFAIVRGKTALLIEAACVVGGMFGGAGRQQQEALREYGSNLGSAFQVIDDLLDYQGDQQRTGKAVGNDLAEGKITLPLIIAGEHAGFPEWEQVLAVLRDERKRTGKFVDIYKFIERNRGFEVARHRAETRIFDAIAALEPFREQGDVPSLRALEDLAHYVLNRHR